jgi:hypothetical protein
MVPATGLQVRGELLPATSGLWMTVERFQSPTAVCR